LAENTLGKNDCTLAGANWYTGDFVHLEFIVSLFRNESVLIYAGTILITARARTYVASPAAFAIDTVCIWYFMRHSSGRRPCRMVVTFRVYLGRISARFDQRKAVMCVPFRVDKWQSPTQPSRPDFARSRCSLIRGSHVRHRALWSLWTTQWYLPWKRPFCACFSLSLSLSYSTARILYDWAEIESSVII